MLLTRAPLYSGLQAIPFSFDLHVLSTPPAFILSQDQTLQLKMANVAPEGPTVISNLELDSVIRTHGFRRYRQSLVETTEVRQYLDPVFKEPAPELGLPV